MKAKLLFIISIMTIMTWACGGKDTAVNLHDWMDLDAQDSHDAVHAEVYVDGFGPADARTPEDLRKDPATCEPEACQVGNDFGTCEGWRYCDADGVLLPCSAAPAAAESCDGLDNNCNGRVDEDTDCEDDNPCTLDQCLDGECRHQDLDGDACDDEDPCTQGDSCRAGTCDGQAVSCDDQDLCTDDWCDGDGECRHDANQALCDDQDPCTLGDHCLDGECRGTPVDCECLVDADCGALEDGNLCNGTLVCDQSTFPARCTVAAGTVIECPQPEGVDAACLQASCDPETGECGMEPSAEGQACVNDDLCTVGDFCRDGVCANGPAANCRDDNPCTDDSCDPAFGCLNPANSLPCQDGSACTIGDTCADGACMPGQERSCDDNNPCTEDSCDPLLGCRHPASTGTCDDLNLCTQGDYCEGGLCHPGVTLDCDDLDPCTTDSCHPAGGCMHTDNNNPCDDSNPYTIKDICRDRVCAGELIDCDDNNPCTDDLLDDEIGCLHNPNQDPCDDQNICTLGDICRDGACVAASIKACADDDPCTDDFCEPLSGCRHSFNTRPCDDRDACTSNDTCAQGQCVGVAAPCDDGNPCTDDSCDPSSGCVHTPNDDGCDDGNDCTTGDTCTAGVCAGQGSADCDDGNPCTRDICLSAGGCEHQTLVDAACSDQDPCTINDRCVEGQCVPGAAKACDDGNPCTDDSCDPAGACVHAPNQADCNDGNPCTLGGTCTDGVCTAGSLLDCDDDNLCTTDYCDPGQGCLHQANTLLCDDGDLCTVGDLCQNTQCLGSERLCDDGNLCTDDYCDPGRGCVSQANQAACDDNDPCTADDICGNGWCKGTVVQICGDGNICGPETCDDGNDDPCDGCADCRLHVNTCGDRYVCGDEACDDGNIIHWDGCWECAINEYVGNGTIANYQHNPCIVPRADNGFLLLFEDTIGTTHNIEGRLFDSEGMPEGDDFIPTTTTEGSQTAPCGASLADGTMVIVWRSEQNIFGQIMTQEGAPLGLEFKINTSPDYCSSPVVKPRADHGFIVTWRVYNTYKNQIKAQRFYANGAKAGEEFMVNTTPHDGQDSPSLAVFSDDSFVIAWGSYDYDVNDGDEITEARVHAQLFQADGAPVGQELMIPNLIIGKQTEPTVTALPDDSFVVAWKTTVDSARHINLRRFSHDQIPLYDEVRVNQESEGEPGYCDAPSITATESGLIFVAWNNNISEGRRIRARLLDPDGTRLGDELMVSDYGDWNNELDVTSFVNGNVAVTWRDGQRQEGWLTDIYIMRYDADMNPIYR